MKLRSTGLGKTLLECSVAKIEHSDIVPETLRELQNGETGPKRLLVTMKVTEPVSWTVHAFMEPGDLRAILGLVVKQPSMLGHSFRFLWFGSWSGPLTSERERRDEASLEA
jgi:hypothetical protein